MFWLLPIQVLSSMTSSNALILDCQFSTPPHKSKHFYIVKNINLYFNSLQSRNNFMLLNRAQNHKTHRNKQLFRQPICCNFNKSPHKIKHFLHRENIRLYFNKLQALNNFMAIKFTQNDVTLKINSLLRQTN